MNIDHLTNRDVVNKKDTLGYLHIQTNPQHQEGALVKEWAPFLVACWLNLDSGWYSGA